MLDFTTPKATVAFAGLAAQARIVHVIGTTGLSADDQAKIEAAARHAAIVKSGNMSLGVNLLAGARRTASPRARRPISTSRSSRCITATSATRPPAPRFCSARPPLQGRAIALKDHSVRVRDGDAGPRRAGDIGFAALRGGDVVGEHKVIFAGAGERIELSISPPTAGFLPKARSGRRFGRAAKAPGLYSMRDVIGL